LDLDWAQLLAQAYESAGHSLSADEIVDYLEGWPAVACPGASKNHNAPRAPAEALASGPP